MRRPRGQIQERERNVRGKPVRGLSRNKSVAAAEDREQELSLVYEWGKGEVKVKTSGGRQKCSFGGRKLKVNVAA